MSETVKRKFEITFIRVTTQIIEAENLNEACKIAEGKTKKNKCIVKSVKPLYPYHEPIYK